jgi:hypothetical protein
LYLNGVSVGTATTSQNFSDGAVRIGYAVDGYNSNCYIDDLRITRFARYTANFTAPTSTILTQ